MSVCAINQQRSWHVLGQVSSTGHDIVHDVSMLWFPRKQQHVGIISLCSMNDLRRKLQQQRRHSYVQRMVLCTARALRMPISYLLSTVAGANSLEHMQVAVAVASLLQSSHVATRVASRIELLALVAEDGAHDVDDVSQIPAYVLRQLGS